MENAVLAFFACMAATTPASAAEPVATAPTSAAPAVEPAASDSAVLDSSVAWWEKVTVTVDDKGKQHSCRI